MEVKSSVWRGLEQGGIVGGEIVGGEPSVEDLAGVDQSSESGVGSTRSWHDDGWYRWWRRK